MQCGSRFSVNKDVLSPPGEDKKKKPDKPAGWDSKYLLWHKLLHVIDQWNHGF